MSSGKGTSGVTRVDHSDRLHEDRMHLPVGEGTMLDTARNDEQLGDQCSENSENFSARSTGRRAMCSVCRRHALNGEAGRYQAPHSDRSEERRFMTLGGAAQKKWLDSSPGAKRGKRWLPGH